VKVIKKYKNRKLYDMDESRYITLNEIKEIMKRGEEVQVIDGTTGEDITSVILTQIIHSEEKKERFLPQEGLKWLLKYGGDALGEVISNIQNIRKEAENRIKRFVRKSKESPSEEIKKFLVEAVSEIEENLNNFFKKNINNLLPVSGENKKILSEIEKIKKRIEQMEKRILNLERKRGAKV
jgi:polyhydroxyalkanoate synthesis repressor PhaR